jgi:outer membrane biogenesis lipoprotein LolB
MFENISGLNYKGNQMALQTTQETAQHSQSRKNLLRTIIGFTLPVVDVEFN